MKAPKRLQTLIDDGLVDKVIRQLKSGKEADVYVVRCGSDIRCAKVYKKIENRSFRQAVAYQEGRKVRSRRHARAMTKGSNFGRKQKEEIWQNAEIDALYLLAHAGVHVPQPYAHLDGVLLMDLIMDEDNLPAPRISDVLFTKQQALSDHKMIMQSVIRMLCIGLVHGDLSEFNVLRGSAGPVIIDLPQVVNASANHHAKSILERDVGNITRFYGQFAPTLLNRKYAQEMWALYSEGQLTPETQLTGYFQEDAKIADVKAVIEEIHAVVSEKKEEVRY
ncbi:PA4780 family RIO1-like protein kinase [Candidatus Williamhamiltonella defendens]|uniref:PA4780 family RIO1-like protein kinase n=1 Tax=Candidatus Williamhamiltonella defendens TaxID=138072 RepID=UPI00130D710E|nr:PA4780 family RIO1-like protein kinase [Candidatus Hamiltonella defensa]